MIVLRHPNGSYLQIPTTPLNMRWTHAIDDARVFEDVVEIGLRQWERDALNLLTIEVVTIL